MKTSNILKTVLFMVLGILLCCSVIDPNSLMNWMIAAAFLAGGIVFLLASLVVSHSLMTDSGLMGGLLLALGIFFLPSLPGGQLINWMGGISMIMMVLGAIFLADSVLGFVYRRKLMGNIVVLITGAAMFTIGICLWLIEEFQDFAGLMLGIFFIVYSVILLSSLVTKKDILVITVKPRRRK